MIHVGKIAPVREHMVHLNAQCAQQGQNRQHSDDPLQKVQDPAEHMLHPAIPLGQLLDVGIQVGVSNFWMVMIAHEIPSRK